MKIIDPKCSIALSDTYLKLWNASSCTFSIWFDLFRQKNLFIQTVPLERGNRSSKQQQLCVCDSISAFPEEKESYSWSSTAKRLFRWPVRIQCSFPAFSPQDTSPPELCTYVQMGIFSARCHSCVATLALNCSLLRLSAPNHPFKLSIHLCHRSQTSSMETFTLFFFGLSNRNDKNMPVVESDHVF